MRYNRLNFKDEDGCFVKYDYYVTHYESLLNAKNGEMKIMQQQHKKELDQMYHDYLKLQEMNDKLESKLKHIKLLIDE